MSNVISIKKNHSSEIQDFLNHLRAKIVDFGILAYRYPSGSTWIVELSNGDVSDSDIIDLLEHIIESVKNPKEIEKG